MNIKIKDPILKPEWVKHLSALCGDSPVLEEHWNKQKKAYTLQIRRVCRENQASWEDPKEYPDAVSPEQVELHVKQGSHRHLSAVTELSFSSVVAWSIEREAHPVEDEFLEMKVAGDWITLEFDLTTLRLQLEAASAIQSRDLKTETYKESSIACSQKLCGESLKDAIAQAAKTGGVV